MVNESNSKIIGESVCIKMTGYTSKDLYIHRKTLESITSHGNFDIEKLYYIESCGYIFRDYLEVFVLLSDGHEWPQREGETLRFVISGVSFELSRPSHISDLIMRAKYFVELSDHYPEDLMSLKVFNIQNKNQALDLVHKGMYYLNSHYLYLSRANIVIQHFERTFSETYGVSTSMVTRRRIRNRKDFLSIEPIKLYNFAIAQEREHRFLAFYRTIEFFFPRVIEVKVREMRSDSNVSERQFIDYIYDSTKNESKYLEETLDYSLKKSRRKNILNFAVHVGLITAPNIEELSSSIYKMRNSLVHAKEDEIHRTTILDPFENEGLIRHWNSIIRDIARNVITALNLN